MVCLLPEGSMSTRLPSTRLGVRRWARTLLHPQVSCSLDTSQCLVQGHAGDTIWRGLKADADTVKLPLKARESVGAVDQLRQMVATMISILPIFLGGGKIWNSKSEP